MKSSQVFNDVWCSKEALAFASGLCPTPEHTPLCLSPTCSHPCTCAAELSGRAAAGVLLNYEGLAEVQAFQGNGAAARATFDAGLAACERPTVRFLRQYALLEKRCGCFDAAAQLYRQAVQMDPQDPKTWLQWGIMERRRRHFEAAEECFRRGVAVAPRNPHLW